jgi:TPR repeat protein
LGKFYFTGEIPDLVAKDHKTSLEWFLKAAWKLYLGTYKNTRFSANHQTTEFRQTTV